MNANHLGDTERLRWMIMQEVLTLRKLPAVDATAKPQMLFAFSD